MTPGTVGAGVTITARSTWSGTSAMRGIGADAQDVVALGVDGKDGAAKGVADQVPEQRAADAVFLFGGADDGHVARRKDSIERVAAERTL